MEGRRYSPAILSQVTVPVTQGLGQCTRTCRVALHEQLVGECDAGKREAEESEIVRSRQHEYSVDGWLFCVLDGMGLVIITIVIAPR